MKKLLLLSIPLFCLLQSFASSVDNSSVTFNELIEAMQNETPEAMECCPGQLKDINFRNVTIDFNRETDEWLDTRYGNQSNKKIIIKNNINFINCEFPNLFWYLSNDIEFQGYVTFNNCNQIKAIFKNCTFHKSVWVLGNEVEFIEFVNCDFKHGFKMNRTLVTDRLRFNNCNFNLRLDSFDDFGNALGTSPKLFSLQYRLDPPMNLMIENCTFDLPDTLSNLTDKQQIESGFTVDLNFSNFSNLRFNYNKLGASLILDRTSVINHFSTHDCEFEKYVFTEHFSINSSNSLIQWSSIESDKIAIYSEETQEVVHMGTEAKLCDELNFKTLVSSYSIFYASYRLQGDRISANKCYREWKDIETIYLNHQKNTDKSVDTYFLYYMNIFLDFFCHYGTSPTRAIKMSFYAMLFFASLYFVFPSAKFKSRTYVYRIRMYFEYFTNQKGLVDMFVTDEMRRMRDRKYEEFLSEIKEYKEILPFYFRLFGKQVYWLDQLNRSIKRFIYKRFDNITGTWEDLSNSRKITSSILYGVLILFIMMYYTFIRVLDALTLSLNAFSTLGFGDIPVKGTVRYITILEGFIGWFLLSIFSVSLISQILW